MNDINFNYIIEHALSCTLEEDGEDVSSCVGLRFGTVDEVLNVKQIRLHKRWEPCLERGKAWYEGCSLEAT